jgi:cytochrome c oxidase subunit 2
MRRRTAWRASLGLLALALAAGVAHAEEDPTRGSLWNLGPEHIGTYGSEIDSLYRLILWITFGTFVITEGLLLAFLVMFRAKPGGRAVYTHGNHKLEVIWTIVPGAILFWLALYQFGTWDKIKITKPPAATCVHVHVLARQFEWQFRYAGIDGRFGTDDDVTGDTSTLVVPVDVPVMVHLRSADVLHSFFLPNLRLKQDTVPGLTITQWFEAKKTTAAARAERKKPDFDFEIACAELCGLGHSKMRGFLKVLDGAEFEKWMKEKSAEAQEYDQPEFWAETWPAGANGEDVWLRDRLGGGK